MRKIFYMIIIIGCMMALAGCSKGKLSLELDEISRSTMLARANGVIQTVIVEDFSKDYYSQIDLQEYTAKEIETYNKKTNGKNVICEDLEVRKDKAIMSMTYTGMEHYSNFIHVTAAYFNGGVKDFPLSLPANLIGSKDGEVKDTKEIIQNENYRVLLLTEPYDVIVDGTIKYYSENAEIKDSNRMKTAKDGLTVIVFKP